MINILYITPNFTIGGTEGQILNLAANLDRSRFRPYVISIGYDYGQRLQYAEHNIETGVFRITEFLKMILFIKKSKIDIVHSFYYGNFSGWELLASKLAGVKIFITSRRNMGYWRKARHIIFDIFRNSFTDLVVANSYAVREKTIVDERLTPSKIIVIYNGLDFLKYSSFVNTEKRASVKKEFGIEDGYKVIGMISNIKNIKGYEYFLNAAKIIKEIGYKVKFVIAGEGSEERSFKEIVSSYGLGGSLMLLGLCKDVRKMFSVIDIFMYSSLSEGFPNIILEAMASGSSIVSTDVGGTAEMLQDNYSGVLVPPRNAKALADAAVKLLNDEDMARRISGMAQKTARQLFGMDECIKQYEFLYEAMDKNRRKR